MVFGQKWRNWVRFYISSFRLLVLVNGSPGGFFQPLRSLRQGNSVSFAVYCGHGDFEEDGV